MFLDNVDRIEFSNPGGPYGRASEGEFGGHSDYRNPGIIRLLANEGYVERLGRGIRSQLKKNGNPDLRVETDGYTRVIVERQLLARETEYFQEHASRLCYTKAKVWAVKAAMRNGRDKGDGRVRKGRTMKKANCGTSGTVIKVGKGRGFFIETKERRYVITAAHCLGDKPGPSLFSDEFAVRGVRHNILGRIGEPQNIAAKCVFVDRVADIAVLCEPDKHALYDKNEAFWEFSQQITPFPLGKFLRKAAIDVKLFSLGGEWFAGRIAGPFDDDWFSLLVGDHVPLDDELFASPISGFESALYIEASQQIQNGMSGSPIILSDGSAVGVVCVANTYDGDALKGGSPYLHGALPAWLARAIKWRTGQLMRK